MSLFLRTAEEAISIFYQAAEANTQTAAQDGNIVKLDQRNAKDVLLTGDLHGNEINYSGIIQKAALDILFKVARDRLHQKYRSC